MPLILGLVLNFMRPDLMEPMLKSTFGYVLIGHGARDGADGHLAHPPIVAIDV